MSESRVLLDFIAASQHLARPTTNFETIPMVSSPVGENLNTSALVHGFGKAVFQILLTPAFGAACICFETSSKYLAITNEDTRALINDNNPTLKPLTGAVGSLTGEFNF